MGNTLPSWLGPVLRSTVQQSSTESSAESSWLHEPVCRAFAEHGAWHAAWRSGVRNGQNADSEKRSLGVVRAVAQDPSMPLTGAVLVVPNIKAGRQNETTSLRPNLADVEA